VAFEYGPGLNWYCDGVPTPVVISSFIILPEFGRLESKSPPINSRRHGFPAYPVDRSIDE